MEEIVGDAFTLSALWGLFIIYFIDFNDYHMFNHQQLQVKGAFDHVSHHLLLRILRSKGIPEHMVKSKENFEKERSTSMPSTVRPIEILL